jgi:hypothetical protein
MKEGAKKTVTLIFILLGFTPLMIVAYFNFQQSIIRNQVREKIEHEQHVLLMIPAKEVAWLEKDEILVNGERFDIYSSTFENGTYTFIGVFDEEETRVVKKRDRAAGGSSEGNQLLVKGLDFLEMPFDKQEELKLDFKQYSILFPSFEFLPLLSQTKAVPTPPPNDQQNIS